MNDLIKREDAIKILKDLQMNHLQFCLVPFRQAIERVQALPSADLSDIKMSYVDQVDEIRAKYKARCEMLEDRIAELKADRPQEWIPCSERLPEEGKLVLVQMRTELYKFSWEEQRCIEFGRISSDRYDADGIGWEWLNESGADYWEADFSNSIVAWMPLPEPWKGVNDVER